MAQVETIEGNLRAVAQLVPGTFQHWDELSADQIADASLRSKIFYVADYPQYHNEKGKPFLALARHTAEHPNNLVLVHLFDQENSSYDQLISTDNFRPHPEEARAVLEAPDTLKVDLADLPLMGNDKNYRSVTIRTADGFVQTGDKHYERPNDITQEVLRRAGYTPNFLGSGKPYNISVSRLYLLNPEYVAQEAGERFLGRGAWRINFSNDADSYAGGRNVSNHSALRGVPLVVAAGAAAKNETPSTPSEIRVPTMEEILEASRPHVAQSSWKQWQQDLRALSEK